MSETLFDDPTLRAHECADGEWFCTVGPELDNGSYEYETETYYTREDAIDAARNAQWA